jgi:hypothetical protein
MEHIETLQNFLLWAREHRIALQGVTIDGDGGVSFQLIDLELETAEQPGADPGGADSADKWSAELPPADIYQRVYRGFRESEGV